ncbi:MAG: phage holin family protein [Anaerolineales bacterium]|nr:phage holin family protein [Anaerolineales bacterium]MCB8951195.1 phage holin family protein [Ardenticatenales bacterium]
MRNLLLRWFVNAIALWVAVKLLPGLHHDGTAISLIAVALIFGLVNALVRPLLLLLTCPLVLLTLGLFVLIVNTLMLSLTIALSNSLGLGISSDSFVATFLGSIVISLVSGVLNVLLKDERENN